MNGSPPEIERRRFASAVSRYRSFVHEAAGLEIPADMCERLVVKRRTKLDRELLHLLAQWWSDKLSH